MQRPPQPVSHSVRSMLDNSYKVHKCVCFTTCQPAHLQSFRVGTYPWIDPRFRNYIDPFYIFWEQHLHDSLYRSQAMLCMIHFCSHFLFTSVWSGGTSASTHRNMQPITPLPMIAQAHKPERYNDRMTTSVADIGFVQAHNLKGTDHGITAWHNLTLANNSNALYIALSTEESISAQRPWLWRRATQLLSSGNLATANATDLYILLPGAVT